MTLTREPRSETEGLSISIVVYRPDLALLLSTLESVATACRTLRVTRPSFALRLTIIDNGGLPDIETSLDALRVNSINCAILSGHGNIGYGCGHNLAIENSPYSFHLVLNPDIELDARALASAVDFLDAHPEAGLLTPRIGDDAGQLQFLCRRYPTLVDLLVRGFLPARARRLFDGRLARYEMRDLINERDTVWDPPIVSGCFMVFRTTVLKALAGFDSRYFLYFEDYDLSLRAHEVTRVVYAPVVRVLHHGGGAARKGSAHIRMFVSSAFKFFNRFGWKWL
ncbi:glycosyltransferase family 2 protein [Paraburkholderia hospita]|uniref:glycosyltransferase family 2 protein n=1 Tax=Paraburkholderia hospita TaxID=169430 RepID=UPI003ED0A5F2